MDKEVAVKKQERIADEGRKFIARVYGWMAIALVISAISALIGALVFTAVLNGAANAEKAVTTYRIIMWAFIIGELVLVIWLSAKIETMSVPAATAGFIAYSIVDGVTLSAIFFAYSTQIIALAFFIAAGMFGVMTIYGKKTKQDLTSAGRYLMMALFGVIIATLLNFLFKSDFLIWLISMITVVIFVGLTAYDTQKINKAAQMSDGSDTFKKAAIIGALELYLDFINIFLSLLNILGRNRK